MVAALPLSTVVRQDPVESWIPLIPLLSAAGRLITTGVRQLAPEEARIRPKHRLVAIPELLTAPDYAPLRMRNARQIPALPEHGQASPIESLDGNCTGLKLQ